MNWGLSIVLADDVAPETAVGFTPRAPAPPTATGEGIRGDIAASDP